MKKITLEDVLAEDIIAQSIKHVQKKKGKAGFDLMRTEDLSEFWNQNGEGLLFKIRAEEYQPLFAEKRLIKKTSGKGMRELEVPCVLDRMILYAIYLVLEPLFEKKFSNNSYGFRKGFGCKAALKKCIAYMNSGYSYVVDLDVHSFFDTVRHDLLLLELRKYIKDEKLLRLIEKYIKIKVVFRQHIYTKYIGIPQGSALSPLLANIFLNSFDHYMDRRGVKYIRYADDIVIFCRSKSKAKKLLYMARSYLNKKLSLQLNMEKTKIVKVEQLTFLGYAFERSDGKVVFALDQNIQEKILIKMDRNIRKNINAVWQRMDRIAGFNRGWINYYKMVVPRSIVSFVNRADYIQLLQIQERLADVNIEETVQNDKIIQLYHSKNFITMSEWYAYCMEKEKEVV